MKSSFTCLLLFSLLVGCVEVRNKDPENPAPSAPMPPPSVPAPIPAPKELTPETPLADPEVKIEVVPLPEPHKYVAVFSEGSAFTALRKISPNEAADGSQSPIVALEKGADGFRDSDIREGSNYVYQMGELSKTGFTVQQSKEIAVPKDFVIDPSFQLSPGSDPIEILGYARVFLQDHTVLSTYSRNLNIQTETLIANNAEIRTFPEGIAADSGQVGRSGGRIILRTNRMQGHLTVTLRGQNGAYGADGLAYAKPAKASSREVSYHGEHRREVVCEDGPFHPAENGERGMVGGNGTNGGNSGSLLIQANDLTDFDLNPQVYPGLGGYPGRGGPGQQGGTVGPVGCTHEVLGSPGKDGQVGPDGRPGADGRAEGVCIQFKGQAPSCR